MAIESMTFEDIGKPVDITRGEIEPVDPESLFGPTPVTPPTPEPTIKPTLPVRDLFGIPFSRTPSIEEVSQLEKILLSQGKLLIVFLKL